MTRCMNMFSRLGINLNENKKRLSGLALKMWCVIVSWCFWKNLETVSSRNMDYVWVIIWCTSFTLGCNALKPEHEFIPDPEICLFFEKGIRGRISYICKVYSKANSKYLKSYDPKQESKHYIFRCK